MVSAAPPLTSQPNCPSERDLTASAEVPSARLPKLGGSDRQGSSGERGCAVAASGGTLMALRVSGASSPAGTRSGGKFRTSPVTAGSLQTGRCLCRGRSEAQPASGSNASAQASAPVVRPRHELMRCAPAWRPQRPRRPATRCARCGCAAALSQVSGRRMPALISFDSAIAHLIGIGLGSSDSAACSGCKRGIESQGQLAIAAQRSGHDGRDHAAGRTFAVTEITPCAPASTAAQAVASSPDSTAKPRGTAASNARIRARSPTASLMPTMRGCAASLRHGGRQQVHRRAAGHVVEQHRHARGFRQRVQVPVQSFLRRPAVGGRHRQQRVGRAGRELAHARDHRSGAAAADAGDDCHAAGDTATRARQQRILLDLGQRHRFAGAAADHDARGAAAQLQVDEPVPGVEVERAVLEHGRDQRDQAACEHRDPRGGQCGPIAAEGPGCYAPSVS